MRNAGLDEVQVVSKIAGIWVTETVFGLRIKSSPSETTNLVALFTIHSL